MFYPDIKKHISPSAIATWIESPSAFVRSYFKGEKTPDTASMLAGTKIHGLIEAGFLEAHKRYEFNEKQLVTPFRGSDVNVLGTPDSYGMEQDENIAYFVDYKSGRDVSWSREELAKDVKMRMTAWLVWNELGRPEATHGYIAWIGTKWNGTEIVPVTDEYMMIKYVYTKEELLGFEEVIAKSIADINALYERFLVATDTVDQALCNEYAEIEKQIKAIESTKEPLEARQEEIKEALSEQMAFGLMDTIEGEFGSFFFKKTKKYAYPPTLEFALPNGEVMTVATGEEVESAMKIVKKVYEGSHDPIEEKRSLQFRAKKVK